MFTSVDCLGGAGCGGGFQLSLMLLGGGLGVASCGASSGKSSMPIIGRDASPFWGRSRFGDLCAGEE